MPWSRSVAALVVLLAAGPARGAGEEGPPCTEDTMIVFDGSGSMAGTDMNSVSPRIAKVREAMSIVLPEVAPLRKMGSSSMAPVPTTFAKPWI